MMGRLAKRSPFATGYDRTGFHWPQGKGALVYFNLCCYSGALDKGFSDGLKCE